MTSRFFYSHALHSRPNKKGNAMTIRERLAKLNKEIKSLYDEATAILEVSGEQDRDLTADEQTRIDAIHGKGKDDRGQIGKLEAQAAQMELVAERQDVIAARTFSHPLVTSGPDPVERIPARVKRQRPGIFDTVDDAYEAGQFLMAVIGGSDSARDWCVTNGVLNAHTTSDNTKGGYTVPETMESTIIRLVEEKGVFRANARQWPMPSGEATIPRRASGFAAEFVGENTAGTTQDLGLDQIKLSAKKLMVLTAITSELSEDTIIAFANLITTEMALAFADKEDNCGFLGDGTSTYGGIVGVKNAVAAGSIATASAATTFAALTIGDFEGAVAKLPMYAGISPAWYVSSAAYYLAMARLMFAAGGATPADYQAGTGPMFLGYPVRFSQVLSKTSAAQSGATYGFFGDAAMAATFGTRRGVTIASDSSVYFAEDALAIRATERFDINVHERGTATDAGPIIALVMA